MATQYVNCPSCNTPNDGRSTVCMACGTMLPGFGGPVQQFEQPKPPGADKKVLAGILGIVLGGFGVHKFILGYNTEGIIMVVVWFVGLFLCGIPSLIVQVIGIVEGIMYLTKSDEEFVQTYIMNKKPWF